MLKKLLLIALALPMLAFCSSSKEDRLLYRLWNDMQTSNMYDLGKFTSKHFQSAHYDGARNKAQELQLIANLHMTGFVLSNIKHTKTHDTIIFTYVATTTETINDQTVTSSAERLSVFQKHDGKWFWIAHANLVVPVA
jgi:hypothetical protein